MNNFTAERFESIGYIFKVEDLSPVQYNVLKYSVVLESQHPYPGYHGKDLPDASKPRNIYFLVKNRNTFEEIARKAREVATVFRQHFNATPAEIAIRNKHYSAIRIKSLESFELLAELQLRFLDTGIRFLKRRNLKGSARIKVHRYFRVETLAPGIFRDLPEPEQCYIEIPGLLNWKSFERITRTVKNNVDNSNFDAALGMMFSMDGPVDLVRIWDRDKSPERIMELREKYLEFIRRENL